MAEDLVCNRSWVSLTNTYLILQNVRSLTDIYPPHGNMDTKFGPTHPGHSNDLVKILFVD